MKKILLLGVFIMFAVATVAQQTKAPTVQEQLKSLQVENTELKQDLEHINEKYTFITEQYQDVKDKVYSDNNTTLWFIGIIVAILGIGAPFLINWLKTKEFKVYADGIKNSIEMDIKNIKIDIEQVRIYAKQSEENQLITEANKENNPTKKIKLYNRVLELNPDNYKAYNNRGVAKVEIAMYEEAIEDFNKAIELQPNDSDAFANIGSANFKLGRYAFAIKYYNKAEELSPTDSTIHYNKGVVLDKLNKPQEAIGCFDKAIELNEFFTDAYINRGNSKRDLNIFNEAIMDYTRAIELNPNDKIAFNNRGLANECLGIFGSAVKDYCRAIELDPDYRKAYSNRSICYRKMCSIDDSKENIDYLFSLAEADEKRAEELKAQGK